METSSTWIAKLYNTIFYTIPFMLRMFFMYRKKLDTHIHMHTLRFYICRERLFALGIMVGFHFLP